MRITIVTVSFNQAEYLEDAIDSVVRQRSPSLEVEHIVVDAGSTDGSHSILQRRRAEIDRILIGSDRGPADGLNKGFALASGSILGFLNADDYLEPDALRTVCDFFASHSELGGVVGALRVVIETSGRQRTRVRLATPFTLDRFATGRTTVLQQSTFFRRSAWDRVGAFNIDNTSNWDAELFLDMLAAGVRFGRLPDVLANFRIHPASITGSGRLSEAYRRESSRLVDKHADGKAANRAVSLARRARPLVRLAEGKRTWVDRRRLD